MFRRLPARAGKFDLTFSRNENRVLIGRFIDEPTLRRLVSSPEFFEKTGPVFWRRVRDEYVRAEIDEICRIWLSDRQIEVVEHVVVQYALSDYQVCGVGTGGGCSLVERESFEVSATLGLIFDL